MKMKNFTKNSLLLPVVLSFILGIIQNATIFASFDPKSTVEIEFEQGDAQIGPVDPDNPGNPGEGGTGNSGALALNYVSSLDFGKHKISSENEVYPALTPRPYIQITDFRGSGDGWSVNARASKFENDGVETLAGTEINFTDASVATNTTGIAAPDPVPEFTLKADDSTTVEVVSAKKNTGMGTWLVKWYVAPAQDINNSVTISVPRGAGMLESNIATITWLLTDAPSN